MPKAIYDSLPNHPDRPGREERGGKDCTEAALAGVLAAADLCSVCGKVQSQVFCI